ncbi:MAG: helix-turn-helix transcriptional regulator [Tissierella sp.]|nr:helix-turn-helix transcriptional regulator [Tissierella sp.]
MSTSYTKGLRAFNGLTQQELAEILGISLTSYNKKETGKVPFTVDELKKLSEHFNVPIENFFNDEVFKTNTN